MCTTKLCSIVFFVPTDNLKKLNVFDENLYFMNMYIRYMNTDDTRIC